MREFIIEIDERDIKAGEGENILAVALKNDIYIPHLCFHPQLKPSGGCRFCLVQVNGNILPSCLTPVQEGMRIKTRTPEIDEIRRSILELLMVNGHDNCRRCPKTGRCKLQRIMAYLRIDRKRLNLYLKGGGEIPKDTSNPFFERDPNKCILCGICVRTCEEIAFNDALKFIGRGYKVRVSTFGDVPIALSACRSCGECVERCPVGSLYYKGGYLLPDREIRSICPYCGVGCGVVMEVRDGGVVRVKGDPQSPVNGGVLCVKGRFGWEFINSDKRLKSPLLRKGGVLEPVSWEEALEFISQKLLKIKGGEFALIASTRCTNEELYLFQKFARAVMGSNNVDNTGRLCYAPSFYALYKAGFPPPKFSLNEIEKAGLIFIAGANITQTLPILGIEVKREVKRGKRLLISDPKESELSRISELHLRPFPGTDLALFMGIARGIVERGFFEREFVERRCQGFREFEESLKGFPPGRVERITGVSRKEVERAAFLLYENKPVAFIWSSGITEGQGGVDNVLSLLNLAILLSDGDRSSMLYPLAGQSNTRGAFEMGCLPDFYPGFKRVESPKDREEIERVWGVALNPSPGLSLLEMKGAILDGRIKALYVIGSDPFPLNDLKGIRERLEILIVQDIFLRKLGELADVVLPAALFAEKDGSLTNMEGRVQRIRKVKDPPGNALPDWEIICRLAQKMGFEFSKHDEIEGEIGSIFEKGTALFRGGLKLTPLEYKPGLRPSLDYPLVLIGIKNIFSHGSLSEEVEGLVKLSGEPVWEINPLDLDKFGARDKAEVEIVSAEGKARGKLKSNKHLLPGVAYTRYEVVKSSLSPLGKRCAVRLI